MRIRFTPESAQELAEARTYYEDRREGPGNEFRRAFDAAAAAIQNRPETYPVLYASRRRVFVRRFPYFLLYEFVAETVVVLGWIHFARSPTIWKRRARG